MAQYEMLSNGLGVSEMINTLLAKTWKAPRLTGMNGLIQMQTEQVLRLKPQPIYIQYQ